MISIGSLEKEGNFYFVSIGKLRLHIRVASNTYVANYINVFIGISKNIANAYNNVNIIDNTKYDT